MQTTTTTPAPATDTALALDTVLRGLALARVHSLRALQARARAAIPAYAPPAAPKIFGSSVKVRKGEAGGVSTRVAYLMPGRLCPNATRECLAACLGIRSGMLALSPARRAQRWKSALLTADPAVFVALLAKEAAAHIRASEAAGMVPALRVDGSTDTGIGQAMARYFPRGQWYDYTKSEARALAAAAAPRENYSLTFSYSGSNGAAARRVLAAGGNVAAVFAVRPESEAKGRPRALPIGALIDGYEIIDGDRTDARFRDPQGRGHVVALSLKGSDTGFEAVKARAGSFALAADATTFPA